MTKVRAMTIPTFGATLLDADLRLVYTQPVFTDNGPAKPYVDLGGAYDDNRERDLIPTLDRFADSRLLYSTDNPPQKRPKLLDSDGEDRSRVSESAPSQTFVSHHFAATFCVALFATPSASSRAPSPSLPRATLPPLFHPRSKSHARTKAPPLCQPRSARVWIVPSAGSVARFLWLLVKLKYKIKPKPQLRKQQSQPLRSSKSRNPSPSVSSLSMAKAAPPSRNWRTRGNSRFANARAGGGHPSTMPPKQRL